MIEGLRRKGYSITPPGRDDPLPPMHPLPRAVSPISQQPFHGNRRECIDLRASVSLGLTDLYLIDRDPDAVGRHEYEIAKQMSIKLLEDKFIDFEVCRKFSSTELRASLWVSKP